MKRSEIRLANVRHLISLAGGAAKFAEKVGISESQLSQFAGANPTRGIGNLVAARIEAAHGQTEGWLDTLISADNGAAPPWPFRHITWDRWSQLDEREQGRVEMKVEQLIEEWEARHTAVSKIAG